MDEYINASVSFGGNPMGSYTRSVYNIFYDVISSEVDGHILDQFMRSHYDAELLLGIVHDSLCRNYVCYKNTCLNAGKPGKYVTPCNDNNFTLSYEYLDSDIRGQYQEIAYYVLKKLTEDYMLSKLSNMTI